MKPNQPSSRGPGPNEVGHVASNPAPSTKLDPVNTVEEVASFAKVSPRTVMRAIAAGKLEALRAGTQLRITDHAVWAWLEWRNE
jgi:excisionase family DNA binding protein